MNRPTLNELLACGRAARRAQATAPTSACPPGFAARVVHNARSRPSESILLYWHAGRIGLGAALAVAALCTWSAPAPHPAENPILEWIQLNP